jgi:hypothetical protein
MLLPVLAVNLLGDWLRDHLDPKLRQLGGRAADLEAPAAEPARSISDERAHGAAASADRV